MKSCPDSDPDFHSVTDANNHTHTTVSDILGRTLSVTPPTGPAVSFTYDPLGNMLTATRGGATVTLTYDNASRKLTMDDPDLGYWMYSYDALAMTSQTDARGCVTNLTYDLLGRPTEKSYSNCPSTGNVTYTYDTGTNGIGRRVSMGVAGGDFTSWNYDLRGRVTSENKQIPDGGQFITAFTYNSADLPVTMTYPVDNEVVTFNYNNNMLPTSVSGTSIYAQSIAYDSAMRMTQLVRGANVLNTVFNYNAWTVDGGRLLNLTTTRPADSVTLQNATYDYDPVGNINTITDSLSGPQTQTFTYDALDRLTNSTVTGGTDGLYTEDYTYDSTTGNLSGKNGATYTYNATHKHAVASVGSNIYGYDQNGNMTSRNVDGQSFTLNYDAENRLVSVTGAATANFYYDADGKQVKTIVAGVTTYYVGNHYEVKNSVVTKYYFAGTTRLAVRTGTTLSYLLSDHLGSSSVTTDASGVKTASALYKAFGESRFSAGNLGTDYRFTGQREQPELGIYFFQSRWYDGALGRFLSPDTIVPTSTQGTQAWDRYAFVNNNPVRYTDPTGHDVDCSIGDSECHNRVEAEEEADRLFDPFTGALPNPEAYSGPFGASDTNMATFDDEMKMAYANHNIDLDWLTSESDSLDPDSRGRPASNPLTEREFSTWEEGEYLGVDSLQARVLHLNSTHSPFTIFLNVLGLPSDREYHSMNYEPNYLSALMSNNPRALIAAKNIYIEYLLSQDRTFYNDLTDLGLNNVNE